MATEDDAPAIPSPRTLGPPFDDPRVVEKLKSLSHEVSKLRHRMKVAEEAAVRSRAETEKWKSLAAQAERQTQQAQELARSAIERAREGQQYRELAEKALGLAEDGRARELSLRRDVELWQENADGALAIAKTVKARLDLSDEELLALRDFVRGHLKVAPPGESAAASAGGE